MSDLEVASGRTTRRPMMLNELVSRALDETLYKDPDDVAEWILCQLGWADRSALLSEVLPIAVGVVFSRRRLRELMRPDREVIGGFVIIFCLTYLLFRGIQILAVSGWLALLSAFLDLLYIGIIGLILLWLFRLILDFMNVNRKEH